MVLLEGLFIVNFLQIYFSCRLRILLQKNKKVEKDHLMTTTYRLLASLQIHVIVVLNLSRYPFHLCILQLFSFAFLFLLIYFDYSLWESVFSLLLVGKCLQDCHDLSVHLFLLLIWLKENLPVLVIYFG